MLEAADAPQAASCWPCATNRLAAFTPWPPWASSAPAEVVGLGWVASPYSCPEPNWKEHNRLVSAVRALFLFGKSVG
jgi:hypothetical protein